jgi:hypothetical protein
MLWANINFLARNGWFLILPLSESAGPAAVPTVPNESFGVDIETRIAALASAIAALRAGDLDLQPGPTSKVNAKVCKGSHYNHQFFFYRYSLSLLLQPDGYQSYGYQLYGYQLYGCNEEFFLGKTRKTFGCTPLCSHAPPDPPRPKKAV